MNEGCQEGLKILREQIEAGEWDGGTPKKLNDDFAYSVGEACIALATFGGWVVLSRRDLLDLVVALRKEEVINWILAVAARGDREGNEE